uniref:Uncharacterized protein n=1 Tax=Triticum urartu TaxID=4572 RepID=A0A8R7P2L0_TRIUA
MRFIPVAQVCHEVNKGLEYTLKYKHHDLFRCLTLDSIRDAATRSGVVFYNVVISSLCKKWETDRAIDLFR